MRTALLALAVAGCGRFGFSQHTGIQTDSAAASNDAPPSDATVDARVALISAIAAGGATSCVVMANGTIKCWGDNTYGQLGHGTTGGTSATPTLVSGVTLATAVTVGFDHACA